MLHPSLLAFDWDQTLADNWAAVAHGLNSAFMAFDKPQWTVDQVRQNAYRSMRDSFPEWFGADWNRAREIFYHAYNDIHQSTLKPMPGADDLLRWLSAQNMVLAVISNKNHQFLNREIDQLGWRPHFKASVGAGEASADKPSPAPMDLLRERLSLPANTSIWYIGDGEVDVRFAQAAGATPIIIGNGHRHDGLQFANCAAFRVYLEQTGPA